MFNLNNDLFQIVDIPSNLFILDYKKFKFIVKNFFIIF
jgi:hypothetical protein